MLNGISPDDPKQDNNYGYHKENVNQRACIESEKPNRPGDYQDDSDQIK
jgi:hypothetical protein